MKKLIKTVPIILFVLIGLSFRMVGGGEVRSDVDLTDFVVSKDGTEITLHTKLMSRTGHIRGFEEHDSEGEGRYLTFYNTYGRRNSIVAAMIGARTQFVLELEPDDTEIYFNRPDDRYELILKKHEITGEWSSVRGSQPTVIGSESASVWILTK